MPNLQQRAVLDVTKDVRAYLRFEVGIIRGDVPGSAEVLGRAGHFATNDPYLESQVCPHVFGHIQHRALL